MGLVMKVIHLVILMSLIAFDFVAQGFSEGSILSPSPATFTSRSNIQSTESHLNGSPIAPVMSGPLPPISYQGTAPNFGAPNLKPIFLVPVGSPPEMLGQKAPTISPVVPPVVLPILSGEPAVSPNLAPLSMPVASPPNEIPSLVSPCPSSEDYSPNIPPTYKTIWHSKNAPSPAPFISIKSYPKKGFESPASSPLSPFYKIHHPKVDGHSPATSPSVPPYASKQGPETSSTSPTPENFRRRRRHHAYPPLKRGSPVPSPYSRYPLSNVSPASSPSPTDPSHHARHAPFLSPRISPSGFSSKKPETPPSLPPVLVFPPPPPNEDCASILCAEPLTNTPSGSPCGCVWPMQVGLRLDVSFYTFFPLVSELAQEIASGVFMRQSQVRIMGANEASQEPDKTNVLINLVPLGTKFDNTTAYLTYERLRNKQVAIIASLFGDYEVLYIRYPGLPDSPPLSDSNIDATDAMNGGPKNGSMTKPFGVDVRRRHHENGLSGSVVAIIVLSVSIAVVLGSAVAWILMFKCTYRADQSSPARQDSLSSLTRPEGTTGSMIHSDPSFVSMSFGSSVPPFTGSTKTFSSNEIEQATDGFNSSRIIGEGGFGRVYSGILEDGTKVAIKTIKRDDQQGGREFMAEVEMLSRLHHRNLVKLIGICTEENKRCLVYELIPNGSVESHLHGVDKETSPLDWATRMKIALGAARGLAYLHEDSSPRVIHRDFKSSNILLEHDFTPKVSDFGLARTATDGEDMHISTRVMGTFGYVAPEYAMTGHLLVKSDVYSYGVVLLELLTGKKPIDMSQPMGLENLVAWARPLLTSKEGIDSIVDPSLKSLISFDSISKVSAIASMCVQPEVSHRPFMSEVVQALKLVCDEVGSRRYSKEDLCIDLDHSDVLGTSTQSQIAISNSDHNVDVEKGFKLSSLDSFGASGSFMRPSSSSPLRARKGRRFWQRFGRSSRGSMSEHGVR